MPGKLISLETYPGMFDLTGYDQFLLKALEHQGEFVVTTDHYAAHKDVQIFAATALSLSMIGVASKADWLEVFFGWCQAQMRLVRDIVNDLPDVNVVGVNLREPFTALQHCPEIIQDLVFKFSLENAATPLVMAPDAIFYYYSHRWVTGRINNEQAWSLFKDQPMVDHHLLRQHCINHAKLCQRYEHPPQHMPLGNFWSLDIEGDGLVTPANARPLSEGLMEMWLINEVLKIPSSHQIPALHGMSNDKLADLLAMKYPPTPHPTA